MPSLDKADIRPPLDYFAVANPRNDLDHTPVFAYLDLMRTTAKKIAQVPGFGNMVPESIIRTISTEMADTLAGVMPGVQVVRADMSKVKWDMTGSALEEGERGNVTMSLDPRFITSRPNSRYIRQVHPTRIFDGQTGVRIGRVGRPSFLPPETQIKDTVNHANKIGASVVNIGDDALLSARTMRATADSIRAKGMKVGTIFTAVGDRERTERFSREIGAEVRPLMVFETLVDFTLPSSLLMVPGGGNILGARFPIPDRHDHSEQAEFLRQYGVVEGGHVNAILGSGFTDHYAAVSPLSGPGLQWIGIPKESRETEAAWNFRIRCMNLSIDFWNAVEAANGYRPFRFSDYIRVGERDADASKDPLREFLKIFRPSKPHAVPIEGARGIVFKMDPYGENFDNLRVTDWLREQRDNLKVAKGAYFDQLKPSVTVSIP